MAAMAVRLEDRERILGEFGIVRGDHRPGDEESD
jgi:hypothetical protein